MQKDYTWSEEWRRICEARHVLTLGLGKPIKRYIDAVRKIRGDVAADQLLADVNQEYKKAPGFDPRAFYRHNQK